MIKAISSLFLFLSVVCAEVRVLHWESDNNPEETVFRFYISTNLTMPRSTWKYFTNSTYIVTTNNGVISYGGLIDLPPGTYYVFGIASNKLGGLVSDMSNVASVTNTRSTNPLRLQIGSALMVSNDTVILRMSNKP